MIVTQDFGQGLGQLNSSLAIAHIGDGNDDLEQVAQGIHQDLALAPFDVLGLTQRSQTFLAHRAKTSVQSKVDGVSAYAANRPLLAIAR